MTALKAATECVQRGWSVIPIPTREKNPGKNGWQQLRITADTVGEHFNGKPQNIGLLLGEPSGWVVDIDLDHMRAVELAPQYLPPTPAIFGREGKPRSHWLYRVSSPITTSKFRSKSAGMIVELRSTGQQTVIPPSIHPSGEQISWDVEGAEPAEIDPEQLLDAVSRLADTVKIELGEKAAKKPKPSKKSMPPPKPEDGEPSADKAPASIPEEVRAARCLTAMLRIGTVDNNDGSSRLFTVACRAVEHDLSESTALTTIREYARQKPFPRNWNDEEILQRLHDAERTCERGSALESDALGLVPLGNREPQTGKLVLSPTRTLPTAQAYIREFQMHPEGRTFHNYAGMLMEWRQNRYVEVEETALRQCLHPWLHDALRYVKNRFTGDFELAPFESNPGSVRAALDTIRGVSHLPATTANPSWLRNRSTDPLASELLPCRSYLLHLPTQRRLPATPAFFTLNALEFDPDPHAALPTAWFEFLHQLFDGDVQSLDLLQEWFGYCLTCDTSQQKMLFMVGPRRSGKGTIGRVLTKLVGTGNVCGPTTSSLAGPFGLQPLLGKTLALVSDARFSGEGVATVTERLLCISGEDTLTVDRKFMESIHMKLATRFMFLSNELPRLNDASGALAGRFLILRLTKSFYGHEDHLLTDRLFTELPGILNWAIEGWLRLRERGYFVMPQSVADAVLDLQELSSPVTAFVREECLMGEGHRVWIDDLYDRWSWWCSREGRQNVTTKPTFGRDLFAAFPAITRRRGAGDRPFYEGIGLKGVMAS